MRLGAVERVTNLFAGGRIICQPEQFADVASGLCVEFVAVCKDSARQTHFAVDQKFRRDRKFFAVDGNGETRSDGNNVVDFYLRADSVLARLNFYSAAVLNGRIQSRGLIVDENFREGAERAGERFFLAVDGDHESEPRLAVEFFVIDARAQNRVADREVAEVEKIYFLPVNHDVEEMERVGRGNFQNAEGRGGVGSLESGGNIFYAFHFVGLADGDAFERHVQSFGDEFI